MSFDAGFYDAYNNQLFTILNFRQSINRSQKSYSIFFASMFQCVFGYSNDAKYEQ